MQAHRQQVRPSNELGDYLRSRRNAVTPEDAGIPVWGTRRVPGLRREELAHIAGISVNYYTRLEQGQSANASDAIIEALARALNLDEAERVHLYELARPTPAKRRRTARTETPNAGALALLAAMPTVPALLLGRRNDVLAWNPLGHALLAGHLPFGAPDEPASRPNQLRLLFLDAHTRELFRDWADEAALAVASLRYVAGQYPDDRLLAELIGDLSLHSADFARLWAKHDVRLCSSGTKRLRHPQIGDLDLHYEALHLPDSNGQRLLTHTATPGSAAADALQLLRR
ncbi:helix-turn-helix domain-containing protein [Streptomyces fungicidicus]|uniref:helix-turn-helix domain-containing protein n=1 Tax=Streptomyces fungicidicus TaxID=68203 RepID=UPI003D7294CE